MTMIESICGDISALSSIHLTDKVPLKTWELLCKVIKASLLPEQTYAEDRPAEEADFESFRKDVRKSLESVWDFIRKFVSLAPSQSFDSDALASYCKGVWQVVINNWFLQLLCFSGVDINFLWRASFNCLLDYK